METKRTVYKVGYARGMHARPSVLLYQALATEAPRARVHLRATCEDAREAAYLDARDFIAVYKRLKARRGDEIEVVARADTGADVDAALAVAGAIIEATEDTLPTHYEVGESIRAEHPLAGWSLQCWGKGV